MVASGRYRPLMARREQTRTFCAAPPTALPRRDGGVSTFGWHRSARRSSRSSQADQARGEGRLAVVRGWYGRTASSNERIGGGGGNRTRMQTFTKLYHAVRTGGRGLMIAVLSSSHCAPGRSLAGLTLTDAPPRHGLERSSVPPSVEQSPSLRPRVRARGRQLLTLRLRSVGSSSGWRDETSTS